MNFCPRCATRVEGAYCSNCGASTSQENYAIADVSREKTPVPPSLDPSTRPVHDPPLVSTPSDEVPANGAPRERDLTAIVEPLRVNAAGQVVAGLPLGPTRRALVLETRWMMTAFLVPVVFSAVIVLAQHVSGVADISRFPTIVRHQPLTNMLLGILAYLPVAATVPLALFLLARTGQDRRTLGIGVPRFVDDVVKGLGIAAAAFVSEIVLLIPIEAFVVNHRSLLVSVSIHAVPKYYVIWGLVISAVTAVTEEVMVNGYLITRLG